MQWDSQLRKVGRKCVTFFGIVLHCKLQQRMLAKLLIVNEVERVWDRDDQGVTKRCPLSWLTNSVLVYEPKCGGGGGLRGPSPSQ
jgi:hypothetical protein